MRREKVTQLGEIPDCFRSINQASPICSTNTRPYAADNEAEAPAAPHAGMNSQPVTNVHSKPA
ncbi:MAG: hypothetical protein U0903_09950 [Planctomycetales bacterium]